VAVSGRSVTLGIKIFISGFQKVTLIPEFSLLRGSLPARCSEYERKNGSVPAEMFCPNGCTKLLSGRETGEWIRVSVECPKTAVFYSDLRLC
jgi:hypothetical protein